MTTSTEINELAAALAIAQGQIQGAVKDSDNPFFKSKYADLESVWDACRGPLSKNGLSVVQMPGSTLWSDSGAALELTTRLLHSSGQWIEHTMTIPVVNPDAQKVVAATTYGRRCMLAAVAGVAPTDDDGESLVDRKSAAPGGRNQVSKTALQPTPLEVQKAGCMAVFNQLGLTNDITREALRVKLMGDIKFNPNSITDWVQLLGLLQAHRDKTNPARELEV